MSTNQQLTEAIEHYLNGEMTGEELARFDEYRKNNAEVDSKIVEQKHFAGLLKQYRERLELENKLNAIHAEIDVHALVEEMTVHPSGIVRMWRNHHSKISVAASLLIFFGMATMFVAGYFTKKAGYEQLRDQITVVKHDQNKLKQQLNSIPKAGTAPKSHLVNPGNYRGTSFALSANGYLVTNYHVVSGKFDSLYVQDVAGNSYRAKLVYSEPLYDIAILKIKDASFESLPALPYSFKKTKGELADDVYSIGYSEGDSPVMDKGYISSVNGVKGDSVGYRVSIPVNPGSSGSPLINSSGNIIGVIAGRDSRTEGASYAIKSAYLFKAIKNIPLDSLKSKLTLNNKNTLAKLKPAQQVKKLQNYVFMVKVY